MVNPLCPLANPCCGCCLFGLLPRFLSGLLFSIDETQIWLGDLRVVVVVCLVCFLVKFDLPALMDLLGPCTNVFLTAYAHVRTEPQSNIGQTRGKKKIAWFPASWASKIAPCFIGEEGGSIQLPQEVAIVCPHREVEGLQRDAVDQVLQAVKFTDKNAPGLNLARMRSSKRPTASRNSFVGTRWEQWNLTP